MGPGRRFLLATMATALFCGGRAPAGSESPDFLEPQQAATGPVSVLILDVEGDGFNLTSVRDGVRFDIDDTGKPIQIGWPAKDVDDAFLALDVNGNGRIDSGAELAGNGMRFPGGQRVVDISDSLMLVQGFRRPVPSPAPKGIAFIDSSDEVYARLRLWIDANHNGQSEPPELKTLDQVGVTSILLTFTRIMSTDANGNVIRFQGSFSHRQRGMDFSRVMAEVLLARQ